MTADEPTLFDLCDVVIDETMPPGVAELRNRDGETVATLINVGAELGERRPRTVPLGRADFLAGLIATWRYGDSPTKPQKAAARELAVEVDRRIRELAP